ncbi:MAG: TAXI family TRAP transporter solute-binding subunit [Planctomycetota bacterium]
MSETPQVTLRKPTKPRWLTWGGGITLTLVALGITWFLLPKPVPDTIRLATGGEGGGYDAFGQRLADELAKDGFRVELVRTQGSVDNVKQLQTGAVDLALVQGGTVPEDDDRLRSLCAVFFEPLWMFRHESVEVDQLGDLQEQRMAIGQEGSGSRLLMERLLEESGVDLGRLRLLPLGPQEGVRALRAGALDVLAFVVSPDASYLQGLLSGGNDIVLHDWSRSESYARRRPYLHALTITPGLLDMRRGFPAASVRMIAPAASIVMHPGTHRGLVMPVIEACNRLLRRGTLLAEPGTFPNHRLVDAPVDEDAARYFEEGPSFLYRVFPYPIARVLDRLKLLIIPLLTLLLPLFRVAPPFYRWRMRSRIFRWYGILRETDDVLRSPHASADIQAEIARLDALEREITEVAIPLSFTDELYHLHMHIDYVRGKLKQHLDAADRG